jgi:hypothetical protein
MAVDCLLKTTALRKGCDNLTVVMIAFEHFEQYVQAHQAYKVKEETIVEVLLPPLLEANDQLNYLNDVEESLKRVYMDQQKVLYLESDEALDEEVQPAFVQDDAFDSEANFDSVVKTSKMQKNLLSEISEEETDVVSMVSERKQAAAAKA